MDWLLLFLLLGMGLLGFGFGLFLLRLYARRTEPLAAAATRFVYLANDGERVSSGGEPRYTILDVERAFEDLEACVKHYHNG